MPKYLRILALALLLPGCSTVPSDYRDPDQVPLRDAQHNYKIWTDDGLNLAAYDTVVVDETQATATPPEKPEERADFDQMKALLRSATASWLQKRGAFAQVLTQAPAAGKVVHLETTIIDYQQGNAVVRTLVGFGAGQPVLMTRTVIRDGSHVLVRLVAKRDFEPHPGDFSNNALLTNEANDLSTDLSEVVYKLRQGHLYLAVH